VSPRGLRRGQVNFRSHNSCLSLGVPSPGRRRACVLFGVFFRGGNSPIGLRGDMVWLALPPAGWGGLSVLSHFCLVQTLPDAERCDCELSSAVLFWFEGLASSAFCGPSQASRRYRDDNGWR